MTCTAASYGGVETVTSLKAILGIRPIRDEELTHELGATRIYEKLSERNVRRRSQHKQELHR